MLGLTFRECTSLALELGWMLVLELLLLLLLLSHFSRVQLCATPETEAHQAPPSLGFSRQEHWSGLPFPYPITRRAFSKYPCFVLRLSFPGGSVVKNPPANAGDLGSTPGLVRSPEKEMGTHSSILAWEIPWTEAHGRL